MDNFTQAMEAHRGSCFNTRVHKLLVAAALTVTAALSGVTGAAIQRAQVPTDVGPVVIDGDWRCLAEDSPNCWWEDPDTGAFYWNGPDDE